MVLIASYAPGELLPAPREDFKTLIAMQLWFDKPADPMQCRTLHDETAKLLMTFAGQVICKSLFINAYVLIDTGATHCFVDTAFAERHNLHIVPSQGKVLCAGDAVAETSGYVDMQICIQSFRGTIRAHVMCLPSENGIALILGQTWLSTHKAKIGFCKPVCRLCERHTKAAAVMH